VWVRVSSNLKFRVFLEKVRCRPLFIILGVLDFDGCSSGRGYLAGVPVSNIFV
jgi:hypothetical protein